MTGSRKAGNRLDLCVPHSTAHSSTLPFPGRSFSKEIEMQTQGVALIAAMVLFAFLASCDASTTDPNSSTSPAPSTTAAVETTTAASAGATAGSLGGLFLTLLVHVLRLLAP